MAHPLERELLAHAQSLRTLARDLVGEAMADDLVQDAAVEVLRAPPHRPEQLGGWLTTIVRRLAGKHRRSEGRRRRRELAAARPEPVPPDRAIDDRDSFARLTRAVLALPEPYQSVLLERYLRDRTPTEIAAARGEPVGTIKTRLQRGLAMLREHLDRDGRDWRSAFATAFGFDRLLPAAAAAVTGVALMGTATKVACGGIAVAALVAIAWLAWPAAPGAVHDAPASEQTAAVAATVTSDGRLLRADPSADAAAGGHRTTVPPPTANEATIRGVCVDANGLPIAGVSVTLRGRAANDARMDVWLRDHARPVDIETQMVTGADGAFAFTFAPPPPFQFALELGRTGLARVNGQWDVIAPGTAIDVGAVAMKAGACVRGRVVDSNGAPAGLWQVGFAADGPPPAFARQGELHVTTGCWSHPAPDGTFGPTRSLVRGRYRVLAGTQTPLRPQFVDVDGNQDPLEVEVVLPVPAPADTIAGIVVDAAGAPIEDVAVAVKVRRPYGSARFATVATNAAGRFRVARPEQGDADAISLEIDKRGFDRGAAPATWGCRDLRVVLQRSPPLEIIAVAADDGAPVEDYRIRIDAWPSDDNIPVREGGHHIGGRVVIPGIGRGRHSISLVPAGDTFAVVAMQPLRIEDGMPRTVTVPVPRVARRAVQLAFADGRPAAGSTLRLAEPCGQPADAGLPPCRLEELIRGNVGSLLLQETTSNERGEATLRGPIGVELRLEILGATHQPVRVSDVSLATTEPLRITVQQGAVVRGMLRPAGALRGLRQLAGLPPDGPLDATQQKQLPRVRLRQREPGNVHWFPPQDSDGAAIADDDSFELRSVPPGPWEVVVAASRVTGSFGSRTEEHVCNAEVAADGETTVELDVAFLMPGELAGLVLHNGRPAANAPIVLFASIVDDRPGCQSQSATPISTDAEGRFHGWYCVGEYRVAIPAQSEQDAGLLFASERVILQAGTTVAQTFHLSTGTVRCHVIDSGGAPVRGIVLALRDRSGHSVLLPPTDADGRTQSLAEVEPLTLVEWSTAKTAPIGPALLDEVMPVLGETIDLNVQVPDSRPR